MENAYVGFVAAPDFVVKLRKSVRKAGYVSLSEFVRQAVREKVEAVLEVRP